MRIFLTGASGFVGGHIHRALVDAGHVVIGCRRSVGVDSSDIACNFSRDHDPAVWVPRLAGIDVVINAVGILAEQGEQTFAALHVAAPTALFAACEQAGVRKVIQISALGTDETAVSGYHRSKLEADRDLMTRSVDWLILRPSIVYGSGARSSELFRALAVLPMVPVVGDGRQWIQPIHIDDLVRAVQVGVTAAGPSQRVIDAVGPEAIRFSEWLNGWRTWLGSEHAPLLHMPLGLAAPVSAWIVSAAGLPMSREAVAMLQQGNRAESAPFVTAFGFQPKSVSDAWRTHPATQADRDQARLFFLRPLLRWSLGLMWLWTGITSAMLYPRDASFAMLAALGIQGMAAPFALYGAALLDGLLGLALLLRYRVRAVAVLQIALILGYTLLISIALPEFWLHPFGPVAKNLPLLVATLMLLVWKEDRT